MFNKKAKEILKKVYKEKDFTQGLYNRVITENIYVLNKKLNLIGYRLKIQLKGKIK